MIETIILTALLLWPGGPFMRLMDLLYDTEGCRRRKEEREHEEI